jgi:hypothetical protein
VSVLAACLVAATAYVGAVTQEALFSMVLPLCFVSGAVAIQKHARVRVAFVSGSLFALVGGEVVNVVSGNYQGSVARSATAGALATVAAVTISRTSRPALFLLPVVGIIAWADALGAGARVQLIAVVAAGMMAVALAMVERDSRRFVEPPGVKGVVLASVLAILVSSVAAAHFQQQRDHRSAASPFRSSLATTIEPPAILSLTRHPPRSATDGLSAPTLPRTHGKSHARAVVLSVLTKLLISVLVLLALAVLWLLVRLVWVSAAWRFWRRRLQRDSQPAEAGAWLWATSVLRRLSEPLPLHLSPDLIAAAPGWDYLKPFAAAVAPGVFAAQERHGPDVWAEADAVGRAAWSAAGRIARARARWRLPQPDRQARRVALMSSGDAS